MFVLILKEWTTGTGVTIVLWADFKLMLIYNSNLENWVRQTFKNALT